MQQLALLRQLALGLAILLAGLPHDLMRAGPSGGLTAIAPASGLQATVDAQGAYTIQTRDPAWRFGGSIGGTITHLAVQTGRDAIGPYRALVFEAGTSAQRRLDIRLYLQAPVVLFTQHYGAATPVSTPFPILTIYPRGLYHLSYQGRFAHYSFGALAGESPWLFFNASDAAFLLSPAAHFLIAHTTLGAGGAIASGIDPALRDLPAGFTQRTLLVVGQGINAVFDRWGQALTALQGKRRLADDASPELRTLGYWTDAGAAYYYRYEPALGYEGTLLAVRDAFRRQGVPLGYLELDSWWYPKGSPPRWQGNGFLRGGIATYTADPALFPDGLASFGRRLGVPLITHARWIDPSSPYRSRFRMSGNVIVDPRYWKQIAAYLRGADVIGYEQDWLAAYAAPAPSLTAGDEFLGSMAAALRDQGITLLYCMPLASHFLQSTSYGNALAIRVSNDHFGRSKWDSALYASRLASAVGLWPWVDVFQSGEADNLLLATLSGGVVGIGDPLGGFDWANLRRVMRADGLLVKPDAPLVPINAAYLDDAAGRDLPMVAYTFSQHGTVRDVYLVAYRRGTASEATVSLPTLGLPGRVYLYDVARGVGRMVSGQASIRATHPADAYYLAVPIGASGMALLGDLGRFVSLGRQRIMSLRDNGRIQATIAFASRERSLVITGYAPSQPVVRALTGHAGTISYQPASHLFQVAVSPGAGGTATILIGLGHGLGAHPHRVTPGY